MAGKQDDEFESYEYRVRLLLSDSELKTIGFGDRFVYWFEFDTEIGGYCYAFDRKTGNKISVPKCVNRQITEYEYMHILVNHGEYDASVFDTYPTEVKDACHSCGNFTGNDDPLTYCRCHTSSCPVYYKKLVRLST